jgi:uncharacterized protein (DUF1684 family)
MDRLDLLDWRRRVFALYEEVRQIPEPSKAHGHWVAERDWLLREHSASPISPQLRSAYPGAHVAPYDPAYRFSVNMQRDVEPLRRDVRTATDGVVPFERMGRVDLPGLGALDVWWCAVYGGGVFLPVRDPSPKTYGGGRYVLDTIKGADLGGGPDGLVVDFNFAYQPSCAYDPAWTCPLAGPENTLDVELPVGELYRPVVQE